MQMTQLQEDKSDILRLRNEVNQWKKMYYDCRRKVVAQAQYVRSSLLVRITSSIYCQWLVSCSPLRFSLIWYLQNVVDMKECRHFCLDFQAYIF